MNVDRIACAAGLLLLIGCSSQSASEVEVPVTELGASETSTPSTTEKPRRPRKPRPASIVPPAPYRSATPEERARAEEAFARGKALSKDGRTREACDAFMESEALDPAVGTEMNLGVCLEQLGDTQGACSAFEKAKIKAGDEDARREVIEQYRAKLGCI